MIDLSRYVGIPFLAGGRTETGADCWGLARIVLRDLYGSDLPRFDGEDLAPHRVAREIRDGIPAVKAIKKDVPEPGDVLIFRLFGSPSHVGVYAGDGMVLHTLHGIGAALEPLDSPKLSGRLQEVYRVR